MCNVPPTVIELVEDPFSFLFYGGGVFRVMRYSSNALGKLSECFTKRQRTMRASISAECFLDTVKMGG
jgi:hypothetical protein